MQVFGGGGTPIRTKTRLMKYILIPLLGILFSVSTAVAQKYSNEFLAIGAGARAQGMGNAAIVSTQDAYSNYWNPAGMMGVEADLQLAFMHAEWFAGVGKYDYLSAVYPLKQAEGRPGRRLGFSLTRFGVDDIPNTLSLYEDDGTVNYDNLQPFSAADYALVVSYAQALRQGKSSRWDVGGNAKVIYRRIGPFAQAFGFGFDLGMRYQKGNWSLGLSAKDITSTFNAWMFDFNEGEEQVFLDSNNEIPINSVEVTRPWLVLGGAYHKQWGKVGWLTELNFIVTTDGQRNTLLAGNTFSLDPAIGMELDYKKMLYLRLGVNNFQEEIDINLDKSLTVAPTLGVGLKFRKLRLDYAFTDISDTQQKTYSHVISLLFDVDFALFNNKTR